MGSKSNRVRVLYSFPHKLGAARLSDSAWYQVNALANAGADVLACPGVLQRPLPPSVEVWPTLAFGKARIPYKLLGKMRALALHDRIVAHRLKRLVGKIDVVHTYAVGALETLRTARQLGIPSVIERSNAHTRFAFEAVNKESERLGIVLPKGDEYFFRNDVLDKEELEYEAADYILCPSEFVVQTFVDYGYPRTKLVHHFNGIDLETFYPTNEPRDPRREFTMLFVGVGAVRKGVHFALEAWLQSPAAKDGKFLIAGDVLPAYAEKLAPMLAHPSVKVLGHIKDVPGLMRTCDIFVLPSIEEGFGRVVTEAMASGCVPLVSDACTELCRHMESGLRHRIGNVDMLRAHITELYQNRELLAKLRATGLEKVRNFTWDALGRRVLEIYREVLESRSRSKVGVL